MAENEPSGLAGVVAQLEKNLQDGITRARLSEIYRLCSLEFGDNLETMRAAYAIRSHEPRADKVVYQAWLKQVAFLHRCEQVLGPSTVRSYVVAGGKPQSA